MALQFSASENDENGTSGEECIDRYPNAYTCFGTVDSPKELP